MVQPTALRTKIARSWGFWDEIYAGSRRVLEQAQQHGVRRVLLLSSGAVYGLQPLGVNVVETAPLHCKPQAAASIYGEGKRAMELMGAIFHREFGMETVTARCFAFAGPGIPLHRHFAFGNFIRDALFKEAVSVDGDGTSTRAWLGYADLAVWLINLAVAGKPGGVYNVGSDQAVSIAALAHRIAYQLAPHKPVQIKSNETLSAACSYYVPNISLAQQLGLDVWTSLDTLIALTANYEKKYREIKPFMKTVQLS